MKVDTEKEEGDNRIDTLCEPFLIPSKDVDPEAGIWTLFIMKIVILKL